MVTDIVPDLLTAQQRAQLTLGLRAQVRRSVRPLLTTNNYRIGTALHNLLLTLTLFFLFLPVLIEAAADVFQTESHIV